MRSSDLNKQISIEHMSTESDGMGGSTTTWSNFVSPVWASIWPVSGTEAIRSEKETMTISHRIRIRFRTGVLPSMRIKHGAAYYNIVSIINMGSENKYLEMLAKEVV